jgi:glycosyltransferase involved in cell wall biosynthesis
MKILNLHTCPNGLFSPEKNPRGGLEKVVFDLHILMQRQNVDIISVCSPSDWCSSLPGFYPINLYGSDTWRAKWKEYKTVLYEFILEHKPDVIIVHGTNKLLKVFNEWEIPVVFVDHQGHGSINLLYHLDFYTKVVPENRALGGIIVGVSEVSNTMKEQEIKLQKIQDNFLFDDYLVFQYITDELRGYPVSPHNQKAITIGLSESYKSPHKIDIFRRKKWVDDYDLITLRPDNAKDKIKNYWEKNIESKPEILSRTRVNVDRIKTMQMLNQAMVYASTCKFESAGITTFEALSMGVPAIIWDDDGRHSSTMFAPEGRGWAWEFISSNNIEEFIFNLPNVRRKDIREHTFFVNNPEVVAKSLIYKLEMFLAKTRIQYNRTDLSEFF